MLKQVLVGSLAASVLGLGAIAQPAQAAGFHLFEFKGIEEDEEKRTEFGGLLGFDHNGENVVFELSVIGSLINPPIDPDPIPDISAAFPDAALAIDATSLTVSGTPASTDPLPPQDLLVFDDFTGDFPGNFFDLSAFLASDVTATATAIIDLSGLELPPGVNPTVVIEDVEFHKVPEPASTLVLVGLGLAGFGLKRSRKVA